LFISVAQSAQGLGDGLDDRSSISDKGWDVFFSPPSPDQLGTQPSSYLVGTRGSFPGSKALGS